MKRLFLRGVLSTLISGLIVACLSAGVRAQPSPAGKDKKTNTPVILIHGIGGSDLDYVTRGIWSNGFPNDVLRGFAGDPENLEFDETGHPKGEMSKGMEATKFFDVPAYYDITDLSRSLAKNGYTKGVDLFEFYYDFRYSVPYTSALLAALIEKAKTDGHSDKVDIVAHSMGGLIARQYLIDKAENAANIRDLVFVATPHLGAPKALQALRYGDDLGVAIIDKCKLKRAVHNLPSMFNLLPGARYFDAAGGGYFTDANDIDADGVKGVLTYDQMVFNLKNGKETRCPMNQQKDTAPFTTLSTPVTDTNLVKFREAQDAWVKPTGVAAFSIVGYGVSTLIGLEEGPGGIKMTYSTEGDGTVPLWSAETSGADQTYFVDLKKMRSEHSEMIGQKKITTLVYNLLHRGTWVPVDGISTNRPDKSIFVRNTTVEK